jgi:hypothetical protein
LTCKQGLALHGNDFVGKGLLAKNERQNALMPIILVRMVVLTPMT